MLEKINELLIADGAWKTLLGGLFVTLEISALGILLGTILGAGICALRMSKNRAVSTIAKLYIAIVRGMPVLMLLMLLYYVVFAKTEMSAELVAVITFGLNSAAYIAEVMRSALMATDIGQVEAARTLGFNYFQAARYVTFPQAVRIAKPVYESTIVSIIQWTSVVGYVTITDLARVVNNMSSRTMQPVFMIVIGMLLYLGIAYLVKGIFAFTDYLKARKMKIKEALPIPDIRADLGGEKLLKANPATDTPAISVQHVFKAFGSLKVLEDIDVNIANGEVVAILGESGCGKSLFLRLLERLEIPDSGTIRINGENINSDEVDINLMRRRMGMVSQSFNLFTHMDVMDNLCLAPCKLLKMSREQAENKAAHLLKRVGLLSRAHAMPDNLSGGQKQRVAIVRCLMMDPGILLFDEPTSALDPTMVGEVLATIRMLSKFGYTMLIVTHEMNFAREVAGRVLFFADRRIYEDALPDEIFDHPKGMRTEAFFRKLKTMFIRITSRSYDVMEIRGNISTFCEKYGLNKSKTYYMKLFMEELTELFIKEYPEQEPDITYELLYSELDHGASIYCTAVCPACTLLEDDDSDHLGVKMVRSLSKSFSWVYENGENKVTIVF